MVIQKSIYNIIGLAQKAGKIVSGQFICETHINKGKSALVIIAEDSSDATKEKFKSMCNSKKILLIEFGTKELLGQCVGKHYRAILSVSDKNFANCIIKKLSGGE